MNARADIEARRKRYAMYRLGLAMKRLLRADGEDERFLATRWVKAWSRAIGERWFARGPYGTDGTDASPVVKPVATPAGPHGHGGSISPTGGAGPGQALQ